MKYLLVLCSVCGGGKSTICTHFRRTAISFSSPWTIRI